jgi:hypothetical protein
LPGDAFQVKAVAIDHPSAAQRKDLNRGAVALERKPQHVRASFARKVGRLALEQVPHRHQPVAIAGRLLEALLVGGLLHRALQARLNRLGVTGEELDHAVDQSSVVGR